MKNSFSGYLLPKLCTMDLFISYRPFDVKRNIKPVRNLEIKELHADFAIKSLQS